jgi:threonyl-tRNA synthetase
LPISEKTLEYSREVTEKLAAVGVRVVLDESNEKVGYKIRYAQQVERVPYMLVIGQNEVEAGNVTFRSRDTGESTTVSLEEFIARVQKETKERSR